LPDRKFPITEGKIFFEENEIQDIPTHKLGGWVFAGLPNSEYFKKLTVLENVR
jgi:ABC-type branched-subunit amino acid transport system ATPase component